MLLGMTINIHKQNLLFNSKKFEFRKTNKFLVRGVQESPSNIV